MGLKVLLINPPYIEKLKFNREGRCQQKVSSFGYLMVPMSLIYIAALLRKNGFNVMVIDYMADSYAKLQSVIDDVKNFSPDIIFFSVTIPSAYNDFQIIKSIRYATVVHLSAIGLMGTVLPEDTLSESKLDSVVRGEPEETSLALVSALQDKIDLSQIKGLSFKKDRNIIHNPDRPLIEDLDSMPFPARDLINYKAYTLPINRSSYTFIIPSRGCTYHCIFCQVKDYYGNRLRLRSIANIMNEIDEIVSKYGISDIEIFSDNFTLDREFVINFCEAILHNGLMIRWMANSRVDAVDLELLKLMRRAGCIGIAYGIETCNQKILDAVRKEIDISKIEQAINWTKKAGIKSLAQIILGLPGETKGTIKNTVRMMNKLNPDFVQFNCAIPYPKTEFYNLVKNNGWLKEKRLSLFELDFSIIDTPYLSQKDLHNMRIYAYLRFYFRLSTLKKIIREIKNLGDLKNFAKDCLYYFMEWIFGGKL